VVFLLMLILASLFISLEGYTMFKRRRDLFSGFDLGIHFLFASTIIQFGPVISDVLHTKNGVGSSYTQSGCKLLHYTTYGMRHVILVIVISLIIYAWMITRHNFNQEQLDKRIRKNFAWLVMLAFAIEAVFGMGNVFLVLNCLPQRFLNSLP